VPVNASSLYARNLQAFIDPFIDKEKKTLAIDWDDELAKGTAIARGGAIVNAIVAKNLGGKAKTTTKATRKPARKAAPKAARKPAKRAAKARTKAPAKRTRTTRKPKEGKTR
jgi:NAD(P) transhydrogenase subunit alpha